MTPPATAATLSSFARAVLAAATTFGLSSASALTEGPCYYIAYRNLYGNLVRTEAWETPKSAVFHFKLALLQDAFNHN